MNCSVCATPLDSRATFCPTCGRAIDDPLIGQVIAERYQIERRIAIGGFGSIYRAVQLDQDRDVALKIMHPELAADTSLVARFQREGDVLCKLLDRHTVATIEVGETPSGLPFIAMELLEGESLLRLFQLHGRMPWQRVFHIARQMCSALGEAHALGVVHRDLKPANIFVTNDDVVKVLDFGIAKIMSNSELSNPQELTVMGTAVGTVEYMAPEQLMGGRADGRTDIYTVGVLAYEMITGRRPFNAAGLDLLTLQLSEQPPPMSLYPTVEPVPAVAELVVVKCLAEDPADRFADVHALAHALDAALAQMAQPPADVHAPAQALDSALVHLPRPITGPVQPSTPQTAPRPTTGPIQPSTPLPQAAPRPITAPVQPSTPQTAPRPTTGPIQPSTPLPQAAPRPITAPVQPSTPQAAPRPITAPVQPSTPQTAPRPITAPVQPSTPQTAPRPITAPVQPSTPQAAPRPITAPAQPSTPTPQAASRLFAPEIAPTRPSRPLPTERPVLESTEPVRRRSALPLAPIIVAAVLAVVAAAVAAWLL